MTQSNATVANLLTNFTPTYTIAPLYKKGFKENEYILLELI
jgi:hypothetical protein